MIISSRIERKQRVSYHDGACAPMGTFLKAFDPIPGFQEGLVSKSIGVSGRQEHELKNLMRTGE